jgi:putative ABC transport system permease protein
MRIRSLVAGSLLLARRRARRDLSLVLIWTIMLTLAAGVAVAAPRFIGEAVDAGAREAVAAAGSDADLIVTTDVGISGVLAPPDKLGEIAADLLDRMPRGITRTYLETSTSARGPRSVVDGRISLDVQTGMLTPTNRGALTVIDGALPTDDAAPRSGPYPVAISEAAATAAELHVGSRIDVPVSIDSDQDPIPLEVVAIVAAVDESSPQWVDLPGLWDAPRLELDTGPIVTVVPLVSPAVIGQLSLAYSAPFTGIIRFRLDPDAFTGALVDEVSEEQRELGANSVALTSSIPWVLSVTVSFPDVLEAFGGQARAAVAQLSLIAAGVLGVALSVLVLMSRLLVSRRRPEFALERARGSSSLATVLRTVPQAVVMTAAAVSAVLIVAGGRVDYPAFLLVVIAVGLLVDPLQSFLLVRSTQTAKRAPANRRDRAVALTGVRARRIAIEVTVVALAVAAVVSIQARGLLQESMIGIDPLLSVAPLLLAAAIAIIVVRVYPLPVRLGARVAVRSPGMHGLMASVRARSGIALLPLLALTLATGLATTNALLGDTITSGQEAASWQRVGADARIDGTVTDDERAAIEAASGVSAVSSFAAIRGARIELGNAISISTAVGVDEHYADVLDRVPGAGNTDALAALFTPSDDLPVLVDATLADRVARDTIVASIGTRNITMRIVGTFTTPVTPGGRGPFLYFSLAALNAELDDPVAADTTLVTGPGADAAVADLPAADVTTRTGWLAEQRGLALVGAVQTAVLLSTLVIAVLAVIALLAIVAAGTRDRARTLSLLRTLGTPGRFGWWLALSDLAPLVVAGLAGGVVSGAVIARTTFPTMGLDALTGGSGNPGIVVAASSVGLLVLSTVLLVVVAVFAEVVMHRRDRLNEVLRVGETV